jgi:Rieske Fe-S protein
VTQEPERGIHPGRRGVLAGVGLAGLAGAVSACSSGGSGSASTSTPAGGSTMVPATTPAPAGTAGGGTSAISTSEIPVGSGKIFSSDKVVITQPASGTFKGFSAVCTHQGCIVDQVSNGTIDCPCHGSQFSIKDGSVVAGPAPSPLPAAPITVTGTSITLG